MEMERMRAPLSSQYWMESLSSRDEEVGRQQQQQQQQQQRISDTAAAVDDFATHVLQHTSPPEACVDGSLGPYVTSILRESLLGEPSSNRSDVTTLDEFESLLELLQEHCGVSQMEAQQSLETIAAAVQTGVVPQRQESAEPQSATEWKSGAGLTSTSITNASSFFDLHEEDESEDPLGPEAYPSLSATLNISSSGTPLKPDRLITSDLLGVLDDPSTPDATNHDAQLPKEYANAIGTAKTRPAEDEAFPPLGTATAPPTRKASKSSKKGSKTKRVDLAAALFRPARTRSDEVEQKSPNMKPAIAPYSDGQSSFTNTQPSSYPIGDIYAQQQLDTAMELLWSMNPELSQDAIAAATLVSHADVNVAQYVIDGALSAPPVCRHMLHDGCYRSDCQFSHTVEGHTCLFWLRGRCGKGESCRFLHGFSESLLEGMQKEAAECINGSQPVAIHTTTYPGQNASYAPPQGVEMDPFSPFISNSLSSSPAPSGSASRDALTSSSVSSSWGASSSLESTLPNYRLDESSFENGAVSSSTFANVATQGYNSVSFAPMPGASVESATRRPPNSSDTKKIVKIPQELWNPHINRNAGVFHIADPLERYKEVSALVPRDDVVDLHYQSTKTFSVVLEAVLNEKLTKYGEVWVVTGSGHHVKQNSHQLRGGALESAVWEWLTAEGYEVWRGRDRNGHGGAVLVKKG